MSSSDQVLKVGDVHEVQLGSFVPGGHCMARVGARTIFVRHGLPGERVRAMLTSVSSKAVFADVTQVLEASGERVAPPCPFVGKCGGCDLQHASVTSQLALKATIIRDALRRQGGLDQAAIERLQVRVEPLEDTGLDWRTSVRWHRTPDGRAGFRGWRDREVIAVENCPVLAEPLHSVMEAASSDRAMGNVARVASDGSVALTGEPTTQQVLHRTWQIDSATFWQGHVFAPEVLVRAMLEHASATRGQSWADLYAGAGLFTAFLAEAVGPDGSVTAVESSPSAVQDAAEALHDLPLVRVLQGDAGRWQPPADLDGIVLDPPRTGATPELLAAILQARPKRIVYVACDPVTFARDVRLLAPGYRLARLDAFDAFPMTHHVETVATLLPISS